MGVNIHIVIPHLITVINVLQQTNISRQKQMGIIHSKISMTKQTGDKMLNQYECNSFSVYPKISVRNCRLMLHSSNLHHLILASGWPEINQNSPPLPLMSGLPHTVPQLIMSQTMQKS